MRSVRPARAPRTPSPLIAGAAARGRSRLSSLRPSTALLLVASLISAAVVGPPAGADQFQPAEGPPTIAAPVLTMQGADGAVTSDPVVAFQPAWPESTEKYHATVNVGAPSLTASLKHVTLCIYQPSAHADSEEDCDPADRDGEPYEPDPTSLFLMVWERANAPGEGESWPANGGAFSVVGDNKYAESGSSTDWDDGTQNTLEVVFGFQVSNAMRKGNDWAVRVEATDTGDRTASETLENVTVAYFEKIVTQRASVDYGVLAVGVPVVKNDLPTGDYSANSRARLSIEGSSVFSVTTGGGQTIELPLRARGVSGAPASNQIAIDCAGQATFSEGASVRLDAGGLQELFGAVSRSGEDAAALPLHSCRAEYGGGIDLANIALSTTVTVSLAEAAPVPTITAVTTSGTSRTVSWDAPAGAGDDVTVESYVVEASADGGATFTPLRRISSDEDDFTNQETTLEGLERDTLYTFRVTANTNVGAGSFTGSAPAQVPTVPLGLSVAEGGESITVAWQEPAGDGGSPVTSYIVRVFDGDGEVTEAERTVDALSTATTFTGGADGDLADGTYTFTVEAVNVIGSSDPTPPSASAELATAVPVAETFSASTGRTGSFQTLTVPSTGTYELLVNGAQGGGTNGGRGAKVTATFELNAGDELIIMAGHRGGSITGAAGGGGASAVWRKAGGTGTPELLAIAGGGGGVTGGTAATTAHASTTANGNAGSATSSWFLAAGGVNGQSGGGTRGIGGAGGGGGIGDGRPERFDNRNAAKITSTQAAGGTGGTVGGFGAGGGASNNSNIFLGGGGGGGYSGGGGASSRSGAAANGGGGGSWVDSSRVSQSIVSGATDGNTGAGSVTVRTP